MVLAGRACPGFHGPMSPLRIATLLSAALTCLAAIPSSASAIGAKASYQVSIDGEIRESWNYFENADGYACEPRYEGNGTAVARFKSPASSKLRVHDYRGFGGSIPVDVTVERQGFRQTTYREARCTGQETKDASGCGTTSYRTRAGGFITQGKKQFGFGLTRDDGRWADRCPLAENPTPSERDYSITNVLAPQYGPTFDWHRKLLRTRKKTYVLKHTKHVVIPYKRSEFGGGQGGEYVADVSYTLNFRLVGKITS
jgi:hypothetical protein